MNCPNCGTINSDTSRFCLRCGQQLPLVQSPPPSNPQPPPSAQPFAPSLPQDPVARAAMLGAGAGVIGGALSILGWFLPWVSFGRLLSGLASGLVGELFGLGGGLGSLNLGSGVGNGLQITLGLLTGSFAALRYGSEFGISPLFGLLGFVVVGIMVAIAVFSVLNVVTGVRLFEFHPTGTTTYASLNIHQQLASLKSRSGITFILMVVIFIILAAIPFGTSIIGSGFYLTILGSVITYLGARFVNSRLP